MTGPPTGTIAAAVVWYDEPPEALERLIASLRDVVEVLVIADGRWELFDEYDAPVLSPVEQRLLVRKMAAGFPTPIIIEPEKVWTSQVEKRNLVYGTASRLADWTLVIDGDEYVEAHDRGRLRAALGHTDLLTARVGSRTLYGPQAPAGVALQPRLFSSADGPLVVEACHNGVRTTGHGHWLTGDPAYVPTVPHVDVGEHLRLFHEQGANRPHEREMTDRRYRTARRRQRVEVWPSRSPA